MSKSKAITVEVLLKGSLPPAIRNAPHNVYHRCCKAAAGQAVGYAILTGIELKMKRAELAKPGKRNDLRHSGDGGWEQWVLENCEYGLTTVKKYIAAADGVTARIGDQMSGLIDIAPSEMTEANREKLLKTLSKSTQGQTLQQLYLDFGIVKANPSDNLRKGGATHNKGSSSRRNVNAEHAQEEAADILQRLATFVATGQHQLLEKADLKHLDDQLLAARECFRPFLKK